MKKSFIFLSGGLLCALILSGCSANYNSIFRSQPADKNRIFFVDAKQRTLSSSGVAGNAMRNRNSSSSYPTPECDMEDYDEPARECMRDIYRLMNHNETIYCQATFDIEALDTTEYNTLTYPEDMRRRLPNLHALEWEHIVPQGAWLKKDDIAASDGLNLYPAIGKLNNERKDSPYGIISKGDEKVRLDASKEKDKGRDGTAKNDEPRAYGKGCDFEVIASGKAKRTEPRKDIRGDIARVHFYMDKAYGEKSGGDKEREGGWVVPSTFDVTKDDYMKMLRKWDREDRIQPGGYECKRVDYILKHQHDKHRKKEGKIAEKVWKECFE